MKRYISVIIIFAATAALSLFLYYQQIKPEDAVNISNFPQEIAGWKGKDIPLEEKVYEILETRNLLFREYKKEGEPGIVLYIIYSDKNRKSSHPPEICLAGGGIDITSKKSEELKINLGAEEFGLKVNYLIAENSNSRELMLYWFKAGKTFTANYLNQQFKIMLSQLQGKSSGGAMLRLSTLIIKDEAEAKEQLVKFISAILPVVIKTIP
ncbi:MAG: exosortase C-terminal domain/associated protein EpsI [Candidatus Omnitrophota bacterium]